MRQLVSVSFRCFIWSPYRKEQRILWLNRNELSHSLTSVCKRPQLETSARGDTQSKHSLSVSAVVLAHFGGYSSELGMPPHLQHRLVSSTSHAVRSRSRPQGWDQSHLPMISPKMFPMKPKDSYPTPPSHFTTTEPFSIWMTVTSEASSLPLGLNFTEVTAGCKSCMWQRSLKIWIPVVCVHWLTNRYPDVVSRHNHGSIYPTYF